MTTTSSRPPPDLPMSEAAGLDGLLPRAASGPAAFVAAFFLAALRRNAGSWLGGARTGQVAAALGLDAPAALALLDRAPQPPAALGEPASWTGRRVPLLHEGRVAWAELFWRPDRQGWSRGLGSFALRLFLPATGRIELRGRIEDSRLDAVLHAERALSRAVAVEAGERFGEILDRLGFAGRLNVLGGTQPPLN